MRVIIAYMKTFHISLLLVTATLLPSSVFALSVNINSDYAGGLASATANLPTISAATTATAGLTATEVALMTYLNYQMDGNLGEAYAMIPGYAPTHAAIASKTQHSQSATQNRLDNLRGTLVKDAKVIDLGPNNIKKFFEDMRSGNLFSQLQENLQKKWDSIRDELSASFTKEALDVALNNMIVDLLQCNTPQLDALFPSINLNLGLAMCDYGKLFNNMKDQVNTLVDKGWGGQFNINGRPVRDIIKDPSSLNDAIRFVSPGQGNAIVADFLSDQSINASYQAKIDAEAWANQLGYAPKIRELQRLVKDRTVVDAQDETTDAIAKSAAINNTLQSASLTNQMTQVQIEQMREQRAAVENAQRQVLSASNAASTAIGGY